MARTAKPLFRSFTGGEITPELHGRLDLAKFQTGLALCKNFWILPHGPAQNRNGFGLVNETRDSSRKSVLIPFNYNTEQTFAIEFGDQYIRWHTNGGTLLEDEKPVTNMTAGPATVVTSVGHGYANGAVVYLQGLSGGFWHTFNGRYVRVDNATADTFEIEDLGGNAINTTGFGAYVDVGGGASRVYEIASPYLQDDLPYLHYAQSEDVLTITNRNYAPRELRRLGATNWDLVQISFLPTIEAPGAPSVAVTGSGGTVYTYKATALKQESLEESLPSPESAVSNDLSTAGNKNTVTPPAVSGAVRYNIYKLFNGLYGYIGQTDGGPLVDNNITPDVSKTPAVANDPFDTSNSWPSAVGYYESRRVFGGTTLRPQGYWLTRSATEANMSYSIPQRDDDAIVGRVKSNEVNDVRHVLATNEQLVFLTSGGPWRLSPTNSDILTPTSALPKQISGEGASNVPPIKTADEAVYIGESQSHLFAIKYKWEANGLITDDISLMAPHLFDNYMFTGLTYSKGNKMLWSVRDDGALIGTTYLPRHEVTAMHQHHTNGKVESVCSVKEGNDYPVYAIVQRTMGTRLVRNVERMSTIRPRAQEDMMFLDCSVTARRETASATVSGLWPYVGMKVSVVADGAVHPDVTVANNGVIALEYPAKVVHIGLRYTCDIETLPLILEGHPAYGQASGKNPNEAWLRVRESSGIMVGPSFSKLRELQARSNENYDTPPRLKSGVVHVTLDNSDWDEDTRICIRQEEPLPLTLIAMAVGVASSG